MLKKELRLNYIQSRKNTSPQALSSASLVISNRILDLPIWSYEFYHLFMPISEKREVDTTYILSVLQGKDKNVVIPKVVGERDMEHYLLTDSTVFRLNQWHIPEPAGGLQVSPEKIDVVFLPLLAFDLSGHRVGYGKGFYDAFLSQCRSDVIKVGVSLFEAEEKITDVDPTDVAMDYCVTPERIYTF